MAARTDTAVLTARHVAKKYGRRTVLRDASLEVRPGTMVAIQGENGAGKSTLLGCLVGLLRPTAGTVSVEGTLGFCPQDPSLFPALPGRQQLRLIGCGYGMGEAEVDARVAELAQRFACEQHLATRIGELSGGTAQKINLIAALLHRPRVLVLDEPYQGFDADTYHRFWDYAEEYRDGGGAVLVVSHMHTELHRFDELVEIVDGRTRVVPGLGGEEGAR